MAKTLTIIDFMRKFSSEESCKTYLADQKWGDGFVCRRCGCDHAVKGRTRHHRRCGSCRFDESATANTLFHKIKFPLPSAFAMVHLLTTTKKGMSSCELARQFGVHQETAWFFKRKVQLAMKACEEGQQLVENVEVDETFLGGREEGKRGRSKGSKSLVLVSVEVDYSDMTRRKAKLKRCRASVIENASGESLKQVLEASVEASAVVTTDGWKGYLSALTGKWHNVEDSAQGANFEALHWHIFNLKNWVRGIHHHVSRDHLQSYLHEFNFRFNNRLKMGQQAIQVLATMAISPKSSYLQLMAA